MSLINTKVPYFTYAADDILHVKVIAELPLGFQIRVGKQ